MSTHQRDLSTGRQLSVMTVCTGNICRSPMAAAILSATVAHSELAGRVRVDSSGTHGYHIGQDADPRARSALAESGYPLTHSARKFDPDWFASRDLILAMDRDHLRHLLRLADRHGAPVDHVRLMRDFDPEGSGDVPDPYYDTMAEFREVRGMLERCMPAVITHLESLGDPST